MKKIEHSKFIIESCKITLFCLVVAGFFKLLNVSDNALLILFNMAVISCASTFSVGPKKLSHAILGSAVVVLSTIAGGVSGFYFPTIAPLITIIYAGLAFYLPKTKSIAAFFVTGSVMFLVLTALPFNLHDGLLYGFYGIFVIAIYALFYWIFDHDASTGKKDILDNREINVNHVTALIAVFSLILSLIVGKILSHYHHFSHLYWISLTALLIIQSANLNMIKTSIKRIIVNAVGALIVVFLFNYVSPSDFWINFYLLVLLLFLIFAFGYSYFFRTLFIELFVLGFAHLLGDYKNIVAFDRMLLTFIGGLIVISLTPIALYLSNTDKNKRIDTKK